MYRFMEWTLMFYQIGRELWQTVNYLRKKATIISLHFDLGHRHDHAFQVVGILASLL